MLPSTFRLKVQKIEQVCLFELSWGDGQHLMATIAYPAHLTARYQTWQRAYLSFYKTTTLPLTSVSKNPEAEDPLRGWAIATGQVTPPGDWHSKLVEAETWLLNDFHHWLRSAELFEIRAEIARASREQGNEASAIQVFLTCTPMELARFPWEAWEIGSDFASTGAIRLLRAPVKIRTGSSAGGRSRSRKARILAILGDETGLNFERDRAAIAHLARIAEVHFAGWQPGQTAAEVKEKICQMIAHPTGWDVLFFAGHSNETDITGGELAIAPGVSLSIREIAPHLSTARDRGLQVALFNSCSGLSIAESLIDLGFSQVIVMREPIHNRLAEEFLLHFLRSLGNHHTVYEAVLAANQFLRLEKNLTYPSAYLIPSLFCHPGAPLFRIPKFGWQQHLQRLLPTQMELFLLVVFLTLSCLTPVQQFLLNQRVAAQAIYRDRTGQVPPASVPPVTVVQIDEASVRQDSRIANPTPINRSYLADIVHRLSEFKAEVIGFDYLLDRPVGDEQKLNQALQNALQKNNAWIVFGAPYNTFEDPNIFVTEANKISSRQWSMQGYVAQLPQHLILPYPNEDCRRVCPFGYVLALAQTASQDITPLALPQLNSQTDLRTQLTEAIARVTPASPRLAQLERSRLHPMSTWMYETFGVLWFNPILDYSIPPDRVYQRIAAWRILEKPLQLPELPNQIVLIGAGEYPDPNAAVGGALDIHPVPAAVSYWRSRLSEKNGAAGFPNGNSDNRPAHLPVLTGTEIHAYIIHHLLSQRIVTPIPDVCMVVVAALLAKWMLLALHRTPQWTRQHRSYLQYGFIGGAIGYGWFSLQSYLSIGIVFPWFLPTAVIVGYLVPLFRRKTHG
jgi:CHASE2 domain/CHAT domain